MSSREPHPAEAPLEPLTRREREILGLLAEGLSGPEIAEKLTLAKSSVKWHIQQLYAKLGVNSKEQAILRAQALGLLGSAALAPTPEVKPAPKHNLPLQVTRFFGREAEIDHVRERLAEHRLVTLTGSGGVGKTRLSLATAEAILPDFADGVWLVELAPLSDPALVPQQVAAALGMRDDPGQPILATLISFLRERQLLLVLDNCEHLLAACAQLTASLLRACPRLRILTSSREPLGVSGEAILSVPSLSSPDPEHLPALEQMTDYMAVSLFLDRARLVRPDYAVAAHNAVPIARICQRLDGIPLALELAAARLHVLNAGQLADRLDDAFRVLTGGSRSALPRQQTLRATVDWSYKLLSAKERLLFQRLSVFAGGCTLEAAEAVCSGDGIDVSDVLDLLSSLVSRSLLIADRQPGAEPRYHLLEVTRQYAREKLVERGEADRLRSRHLDFYLQLAQEIEPKLKTGERLVRTRQLGAEGDNFRAALEWSLADVDLARAELGLRLACALRQFWHYYGYYAEGRRWLEKGLAAGSNSQSDVTETRAWALYTLAYLTQFQGNREASAALYEASIGLYRQIDAADPRNLADALTHVAMEWGMDNPAARAAIEEAVAICRALGPAGSWDLARALAHHASVAEWAGDDQSTQARAEESVALYRQSGDIWEGQPFGTLVSIAWRQGDFAKARAICEDGLQRTRATQDKFATAGWLEVLADLSRIEGDYETVIARCQEILRLHHAMGNKGGTAWNLRRLGIALLLQAAYEPAQNALLGSLALLPEIILSGAATADRVDADSYRAVAITLAGLAEISWATGHAARAAELLQTAELLILSISGVKTAVTIYSSADQIEYERLAAPRRGQLQKAALTAAPVSQSITLGQAIDLGLET